MKKWQTLLLPLLSLATIPFSFAMAPSHGNFPDIKAASKNVVAKTLNNYIENIDIGSFNDNKRSLVKYDALNNFDLSDGGFVFQDSNGTMYIGTKKGLDRIKQNPDASLGYDVKPIPLSDRNGNNAKEFATNHGFMYQTRDGSIYVGISKYTNSTSIGGLWKLENDHLVEVDNSYNLSHGFMKQMEDGRIFVGTNNFGLKELVNNRLTELSYLNLAHGSYLKASNGTIYVLTKTAGIRKFDSGEILEISSELSNADVSDGFIYEGKDQTIYVGTKKMGLQILKNDVLTKIPDQPANIDFTNGFMYQTSDDTIYVGTNGQGIMQLVDGKLVNANSDLKDYNGKKTFMFETKKKEIFIGSSKGLAKIDGNSIQQINSFNFPASFMVQTKSGDLLVGTKIGLKKLNSDHKSVDISKNFAGLSDDISDGFATYIPSEDVVYVGTSKKLVKIYGDGNHDDLIYDDFTNGMAINVDNNELYFWSKYGSQFQADVNQNGISRQKINNTNIIDVRDGAIIEDLKSKKIYLQTKKRELREIISTDMESKKVLENVEFVLKTSTDEIYVGTSDQGLLNITGDSKQLISNSKSYSFEGGFIFEGNEKEIYVKTKKDGLFLLNENAMHHVDITNSTLAQNKDEGMEVSYLFKDNHNIIYAVKRDQGIASSPGKIFILNNGLIDVDTKLNNQYNFVGGFIKQTRDSRIFVSVNDKSNPSSPYVLKELISKKDSYELEDPDFVKEEYKLYGSGFMFQDNTGVIYLGDNRGLKYIDKNNQLVEIENSDGSSIEITNGFMYQTRNGSIYIGTDKGLRILENDRVKIVSNEKLVGGFMHETQDGTIYVGTASGVKVLVDGQLQNKFNVSAKHGFMFESKAGTIYLGTENAGLQKIVDDQLVNVSSKNVARGFMYELQDGTTFVGTKHDGLMNLVNGQLKKYEYIYNTSSGGGFRDGYIYQSQNGKIFIGDSNGLQTLNKIVKYKAFNNMRFLQDWKQAQVGVDLLDEKTGLSIKYQADNDAWKAIDDYQQVQGIKSEEISIQMFLNYEKAPNYRLIFEDYALHVNKKGVLNPHLELDNSFTPTYSDKSKGQVKLNLLNYDERQVVYQIESINSKLESSDLKIDVISEKFGTTNLLISGLEIDDYLKLITTLKQGKSLFWQSFSLRSADTTTQNFNIKEYNYLADQEEKSWEILFKKSNENSNKFDAFILPEAIIPEHVEVYYQIGAADAPKQLTSANQVLKNISPNTTIILTFNLSNKKLIWSTTQNRNAKVKKFTAPTGATTLPELPQKQQADERDWLDYFFIAMIILGSIGAILSLFAFWKIRRYLKSKKQNR